MEDEYRICFFTPLPDRSPLTHRLTDYDVHLKLAQHVPFKKHGILFTILTTANYSTGKGISSIHKAFIARS